MTMPDSTPTLIERLDGLLAAGRPEYHRRLRPGATDEALDAFEARFALRLPAAFRAFYRWRDGQESGHYAPLEGNRRFVPLAEVAESKAMLDGMIGLDFEDPRWWRRGWVPFLHNGGGDRLCLDVRAEDGGEPGQLVAFWHDWERRSVEAPSFEAWLARLGAAMEDGTLELA